MNDNFDVFSSKFAQDIYLQKYSLDRQETWSDTCRRVVANVTGQLLSKEEQESIYQIMLSRKFIPGGRYLYASGRPLHQVNNCFLFRIEDSREGWADAMGKATSALMTGGGIGFDYSLLREEGALIRGTGGTSTGPIAIMNMVNESGRYIMQGGQRRCLPEGSRVHTKKGLVPIELLERGDLVLTTEGYKKVKAKIYQGVQGLIKIKTQNGEFECTPNHRIAVIASLYGHYEWKEAQNLEEGDRLYFSNEVIPGEKTELPENTFIASPNAYTLNRIKIPKLTPQIAWFFGLLHGDGYVMLKDDMGVGKRHGRVQIACSKDYPEIKDKAVAAMSMFGVPVYVGEGDGDLWNVKVNSVELASYLSQFKFPKTAHDVPEFIKRGLPEIRAAYIAGLMDADGSCSSRPILIAAQIYPDYLKQVQELCSSLGIATRIKTNREATNNWKTLYHLTVSTGKQLKKFKTLIGEFGHKCDFHIPEGAQQFSYSFPNTMTNETSLFKRRGVEVNTSIEKVESVIGPQNFTPVKVINLTMGEEFPTWDIEVEDKSEFFVNGILVHNSAIWAGLNWSHPDIKKFMALKNWPEEVKRIKEKDFTFPVPMELTNISVIYDTEFFIAVEDSKHPKHKIAKEIWADNCKQAFSTAEPGMSMNFRKDNESLRNACTEVVSEDDSDKCNLGTIWINRVLDKEDLANVTRLATKFLLCGGIYSDVPNDRIRQVGNKNNRIGLGLGGIHEWLMVRGSEYEVTPELHKWLSIYEQESDGMAFVFAKQLGVSVPKGVRAIAPTGCQKGETLVVTEEGIFELQELGNDKGDQWQLLNLKVAQETKSEALASRFFVNGKALTKKITLSSGQELESTYNHQYRILVNGDYVWARADSLKSGDTVVSYLGGYSKISEPVLFPIKKQHALEKVPQFPTTVTENLAEFLGIFYGDGSIHEKGIRIACNAREGDYKHVITLGKDLFNIDPTLEDNGRNCLSVCFNSKPLLRWLYINNFDKPECKVMELPTVIRTFSKTSLEAFLKGYWFADGSITKNKDSDAEYKYIDTSSKKFAQQLVTIHRALGRDATIQHNVSGFGYDMYRVRPILTKNRNKTKEIEATLTKLNLENCSVDKVIAVEDGETYTFDIEVPSTTTYIANGIVSHNTIGIIAETTTGIEPLFCKAYKRRYLKEKTWVYQYVVDGAVKRLLSQGVKLENIKDSYDLTFKQRVKFQADVQNYVDMAISSTCNLPSWGTESNNEETLKTHSKLLLKYAKRLRGFTCYPDGARGGQPLTRVALEEAMANEGVVFEETEQECLNGVCGI